MDEGLADQASSTSDKNVHGLKVIVCLLGFANTICVLTLIVAMLAVMRSGSVWLGRVYSDQ